MQAMTKIALISASVLSMGALTACQSTSNVPNNEDRPPPTASAGRGTADA